MPESKMIFHHIGIASDNIENSLKLITYFFDVAHVSDIVYDPHQNAYVCMVGLSDGTKIELVSGKQVEGMVKKKRFLYHICYEVNNMSEMISMLMKEGFVMISEPVEAILFNNRKVAFFNGKFGIMEILEK